MKISLKVDGKFDSGNDKYIATIKNLSGDVIYTGTACLSKDKVPLFDEKPLYNVEYTIEE